MQYILDSSKSKRLKYYLVYSFMALKVMFVYGGFGVVSDSIKAITCVKIGSFNYRLLDKRVKCLSDFNEEYDVYLLAIFLILIFSVFMPLYLFIKIRKYIAQK